MHMNRTLKKASGSIHTTANIRSRTKMSADPTMPAFEAMPDFYDGEDEWGMAPSYKIDLEDNEGRNS